MKIFTVALLLFVQFAHAQQGWYRAVLQRQDGHNIVFNFEWAKEKGKDVWYVRNVSERIRVTDITVREDSVLVQMPVFESQFKAVRSKQGLHGVWIKGTVSKEQVMPFSASFATTRFATTRTPTANISGRWAVQFGPKHDDPAVGIFVQQGRNLMGTFLTPTGDYRYLEGAVDGDTLKLTTFDGAHAYYFTALIANDSTLRDGWHYSGATAKDPWVAVKDAHAQLPADAAVSSVKDGQDRLHFTFPDLDGKPVSIDDTRFKNKAVIIQIMGSWCPNCMDETAFLSNYYRANRQKGIEIIGLAYEYSTDFERSQKSLRKFQQRFNVTYPMLITGVKVSDTLRTEKTLPQITPIKGFPTTIFIGRDGRIKKIETGYAGPGTGAEYEKQKKDFYDTVEKLLKGE